MLDLSSDAPAVNGLAGQPGEAPRPARSLIERTELAARVAARHAAAVDAEGRFPAEAFEAIRAERLLGISVPVALGGEEASVATMADVCYRLGRACASTGMIYAMHQIKAACLVRHGLGNAWQEGFLRRLSSEQLLLASSTTEGKGGGNVRASDAPIEREGSRIRFERDATVMSYGAQADAIVTTARRDADASTSTQVLAVFCKEDYALDLKGGWNTMGMRGTCSGGFALKATGCADQVLSVPYDAIHAETMTPTAHLLWSSVWAGIAAAAVERAQMFTRKAARQAGGQLPPGAAHVTKAASSLGQLRGLIAASIRRYDAALADPALLASLEFQTAITLLKVEASELAVATVLGALRACGLSGYRNDGDASVARHLRDVLSSPLMINNDRILSSLASASLMTPVPATLSA